MSVIGPRPGLWNQDILTAERDKYNANDVKPGLTGWAQINGRDELEIPVKAKLDGEYVKKMGPVGFLFLIIEKKALIEVWQDGRIEVCIIMTSYILKNMVMKYMIGEILQLCFQ